MDATYMELTIRLTLALLLGGALFGLDYVIPGIGIFPKWEEAAVITAVMVALGVLVAVICTLPVVNRFVNMKSNKIFLY